MADKMEFPKTMKEFIEKQTDMVEEKIKVTSLEIIVTGTKDKPYFEIKYKKVGKEDCYIGYSSYDLNNVFGWKEECFEIVNQLAEEYSNDSKIIVNKDIKNPFANMSTVGCVNCDHKDEYIIELEADNGWIPVSSGKLPENVDFVMYTQKDGEVDVCSIEYFYDFLEKFAAWQPLPAPYQPKENSEIPNNSINATWKQRTMNRFERVE